MDSETAVLLHSATLHRNVKTVQSLLEKNAQIDACNSHYETALHLAAKNGYSEIVEVLLNSNASVTVQTENGSTPLLLALEGRHEEVVQMLLEYSYANFKDKNFPVSSIFSAKNIHIPLLSPSRNICIPSVSCAGKRNSSLLDCILLVNPNACERVNKLVVDIIINDNGHRKIVDHLIDHGFSLSHEYISKPFLISAIQKKHMKIIKSIMKDAKYNLLPLLYMVVKNESVGIDRLFYYSELVVFAEDEVVGFIKLLLAEGADIKKAPEFLHLAVQKIWVEVCKILIENGADTNALDSHSKRTPLLLSLDCGYVEAVEIRQKKDEIVQLLMNNGANAYFRDSYGSGLTAFHLAAFCSRKAAVGIFLNFGVDVDLRAEDDSTPLHWACNRGDIEIIEMLCKNKANVNARKKDGCTPLHCALQNLLSMIDTDFPIWDHEFFMIRTPFPVSNDECVTCLVNRGCDINVENNDGKTVLYLAILLASQCYFISSQPLTPGIKSLIKHAIKLKAAGLYVCEKNLHLLSDLKNTLNLKESENCEFSSYQQECVEEVSRMRSKELDSQVTFYDFLVNEDDSAYAKNIMAMKAVDAFDINSFSIYQSLIIDNVKKSKLRFNSLNKGKEFLQTVVEDSSTFTCVRRGKKCSVCITKGQKCLLPDLVLEQIVLNLSNDDLKSFIFSGRDLRQQTSSVYQDIHMADEPPRKIRCIDY